MEEDIVIRVPDITGREVLSRRRASGFHRSRPEPPCRRTYMVVMASERGSERELIIIR